MHYLFIKNTITEARQFLGFLEKIIENKQKHSHVNAQDLEAIGKEYPEFQETVKLLGDMVYQELKEKK